MSFRDSAALRMTFSFAVCFLLASPAFEIFSVIRIDADSVKTICPPSAQINHRVPELGVLRGKKIEIGHKLNRLHDPLARLPPLGKSISPVALRKEHYDALCVEDGDLPHAPDWPNSSVGGENGCRV
ncbi:hypothetical protein C8R43DRAFT_1118504 [Mycena crocata]|nr:hypothetical protein C8R43DRAFT_1118504 [Mycena crocata]